MTGLIEGADPTSPYGMSQQALAKELITTHGMTRTAALAMGHKQRADAVVKARKEAEEMARCAEHETANCAECSGVAKAHDESLTDAAAYFDAPEPAKWDDDIDPEALMAEITHVREVEEQHATAHGLLVKDPDTLDYSFDGHAGAGPSASSRWITCTASVGASREFLETLTPNQQVIFANSNEAARQGTTAHAAAEVEARVALGTMSQEEADLTLLELAVEPDAEGEAYDEEMGEYITEYVDLVKSYAHDRGPENVLIEQRVSAAVPLTGMHEGEVYEIHGSVDFGALPDAGSHEVENHSLVVGDLKYGNGIWVGVDENTQAMIYALGLLALMVDEDGRLPEWLVDVVLYIIQPRMDGIKTATITVEALLTWRDEVLAPALTNALYGADEGATFVPTDGGCQFCPARGSCPALAEDRMERASELFDVQLDAEYKGEEFPETSLLSHDRLGELLAQVSGLIDIHKDLKAEAERRLYRGEQVPGYQLVNYTPPRKWKDEAAEQLQQVKELWTAKMVTPTQALKIAATTEGLDPDDYADLIDAPDKRPVVAKVGDRRKTWEGRPPEAMFDVEEEA